MMPRAWGPSSAPSGRKMTAGVSDGAKPSADRVRRSDSSHVRGDGGGAPEPAVDGILAAELAAADVAGLRCHEAPPGPESRSITAVSITDGGTTAAPRRVAHDQTDQPPFDREEQRAVSDVRVVHAGERGRPPLVLRAIPVRPMNTGCSVGPSIVAVASPKYANPENASGRRFD